MTDDCTSVILHFPCPGSTNLASTEPGSTVNRCCAKLQRCLLCLLCTGFVSFFPFEVASLACAENPPLANSANSSGLPSPASESFAQFKQRILTLSHNAVTAVQSEGISQNSLTAQQDFVLELKRFLTQSPGDPSLSPTAPQPGQQPTEETSTTPSPSIENTGAGATAGEASTSDNSSTKELGPLPQRLHLTDAVWGHLPPQEQNDLLRTYSESYLPGYEQQVRSYFEQLTKLRRKQSLPPEPSLTQ